MKLERKRVLEKSIEFDMFELHEMSFSEIANYFSNKNYEYENYLLNNDIEVKFEITCVGYDGLHEYYFRFYRWETDAELEKRQREYDKRQQAKELKAQERLQYKQAELAKNEALERLEYERLRKKYEK